MLQLFSVVVTTNIWILQLCVEIILLQLINVVRESSSLLNKIKKDKQQDHPDNGLKSIRFTGPGQDFGNAATAASKVYIMIS